jgi:hypothetical protein
MTAHLLDGIGKGSRGVILGVKDLNGTIGGVYTAARHSIDAVSMRIKEYRELEDSEICQKANNR